MPDKPQLAVQPFRPDPVCQKCGFAEVDLEYCGQEEEVTSGAGQFLRYQGREILIVTCSHCGYFWHMEPADRESS